MSVMSVVVSHDAPVVASMDAVIDVSEVVAGNFAGDVIDPYFTAQLPISALVGNLVRLVDNFHISHDAFYHG